MWRFNSSVLLHFVVSGENKSKVLPWLVDLLKPSMNQIFQPMSTRVWFVSYWNFDRKQPSRVDTCSKTSVMCRDPVRSASGWVRPGYRTVGRGRVCHRLLVKTHGAFCTHLRQFLLRGNHGRSLRNPRLLPPGFPSVFLPIRWWV